MSGLWSFRCDGIAGDCRRAEVEHALDVEGQLCEQLRGEALGVDARARRHQEGRARIAGHAAAAAAEDEEDEDVGELISRLRQTFRGAGDDDEAEVEDDDTDLGFAELRKLFPDDAADDAAATAAPTAAASGSYDGVIGGGGGAAAADDDDCYDYGSESESGGAAAAAPLEEEDAFHELRSLLRGGESPLRSPAEDRRAGASGDLDCVMESLAATAAAAGAATPRRRRRGAPLSLEDGALPLPHCEQRLYDPREYPALFEVQMLAESGARRPAPAVLPPEYDISTLDLRGAARPLPLPLPTSPPAAAATPQARRRAKPRPLPEAPLRTPPPASPATPRGGAASRVRAEARATPARHQKRKVMRKKMAPAAAVAAVPPSSPVAGAAGAVYGGAALADVAVAPPLSASPTAERRARDLETLLACELLSIPASSRSPEERVSPLATATRVAAQRGDVEEKTSTDAAKAAAFVEELAEEERPDTTGEGGGDATLPVAFTGLASPVLDVWSEEGYAAVEAAVEAEASLGLPEAVVASPTAAAAAPARELEETGAAAAEEAEVREAEENWTPPPPPPPPPEAFAVASAPTPTPVHASPDAAPRLQAWAAVVPSPPSPNQPTEDGFADTRVSPPPCPSPSSSSDTPPQPQTQSPEPYRMPAGHTPETPVAPVPVAAPATEEPCCLADVPPSPLCPAAAAAEPRPTALQRAMSKRGSPFLAPAADPQSRQPPPPPPQAHATRIDRVVSALRTRAETAQQAGAALLRRPVAAAAEQPQPPLPPASVALADLPRRRANSGSTAAAATLPPLEPRPATSSSAAASTAAAVASAKSNIVERRLHRQAARDALQQRYAAIQEQKAAELRRLAELKAAEEALEQARAQEARRARRAEERRKAAERATRRGARLERWDAAVSHHNRTLLRAYGLRPLARNVEAARARARAAAEADRVRLQRVALRGWTAAQAQWERVRQVVHVLRCVQLSRVLRACFLRGMLRRWRGVGRAQALQETHAAAVGRRRAQEGAWAVWRAAYVRRVTLVRHRQESLADKLRARLDGQRTLRCLRVWRGRAEERQAEARRAQFRQRMMGAVQDILSEPLTLRQR